MFKSRPSNHDSGRRVMKRALWVIVLVWFVLQFMPRVNAQQEEQESKGKQTGIAWAYGFPASATQAQIVAAMFPAPRGGRGGGAGGPAGGGRGAAPAPGAPPEPAEGLDAIRDV